MKVSINIGKCVLVFLVLLMMPMLAYADDISDCGSLNVTNTYYNLTQNVQSNGTCFTFAENNITLDCQGYMINYSQTESGNGITGSSTYDYNNVLNCNIVDGGFGSYAITFASGNDYHDIINNNITTLSTGMYLRSDYTNVTGNNIFATLNGIQGASGGLYNNFTDNNIVAGGVGMAFSQNAYNQITNNNINATGSGITTSDSGNYNITGNTINSSVYGISTGGGCNGYLISGNTIYAVNGIRLTLSDTYNISSNVITATGYGLITTSGATGHTIYNNTITSTNSSIAFTSTGGDTNTIYENILTSSDSVLYILSDGNTIYNNLINGTLANLTTTGNSWNTSNQTGMRIFSNGTYIGGNYYTNSTNDGYSDVCVDLDTDGFCDVAFTIGDFDIDYLALSDEYTTPTTTTTTIPTPSGNIIDEVAPVINGLFGVFLCLFIAGVFFYMKKAL